MGCEAFKFVTMGVSCKIVVRSVDQVFPLPWFATNLSLIACEPFFIVVSVCMKHRFGLMANIA